MTWDPGLNRICSRRCCLALAVALGLVGTLLVTMTMPSEAVSEPAPIPLPGVCTLSDRFGIAVPGNSNITDYDVGQTHAGWYHSFGLSTFPAHPAGMGYVQTIRLSDDVCDDPSCDRACVQCPSWDYLAALLDANPSSLWFIGNEPDRVQFQDGVHPENYAQIYRALYDFIKTEDPSSLVGVGGVVQPTPVRLEYLDLILAAYQSLYTSSMPIDVWNTHNYVLREKRPYSGCPDCWGADIPPGVPDDVGMLYEIGDHDNMTYWIAHLTSLRQWMRDRGYRDRPLVVSEYGILMPKAYGYDLPRVRAFLSETFEWLMTAIDASTGYPADGNRLVQAWAWYSLDYDGFEGQPVASNLFVPTTRDITPLGQDVGDYTFPYTGTFPAFPGSIDLEPRWISHSRPEAGASGLVSVTVSAAIWNGGASSSEDVRVSWMRNGQPAGQSIIATLGSAEEKLVSVTLPNLTVGQRLNVSVTVAPGSPTVECDPFNNTLSHSFLVADRWLFLPWSPRHR